MSTLHIVVGPLEFTARLEEEAAPATCAAFRKLLPFRHKLIHARWSGEAAWIPLLQYPQPDRKEEETSTTSLSAAQPPEGAQQHSVYQGQPNTSNHFALDFENHTSHPAPGQILFYPGGFSEPEILFPYGSTCFASKVGQLAGNHFLTITENTTRLRELGQLVLWKGAQDILFEA